MTYTSSLEHRKTRKARCDQICDFNNHAEESTLQARSITSISGMYIPSRRSRRLELGKTLVNACLSYLTLCSLINCQISTRSSDNQGKLLFYYTPKGG